MSCLSRKFVAVLLAVWLPLFSGSALAASIGMQSISGDCHMAQQASHQRMHHAQPAANDAQSAGPQHSQNPSCNNCGVCQIACSGYLAAATIEMAEAQPPARLFTSSSTQFQSVTSAPLDPPPLARV